MNINELNKLIKNKISKKVLVENIIIEDKTFLHLRHKNFQKNKFHLKITIKSNELSKMSKINSTKFVNSDIFDYNEVKNNYENLLKGKINTSFNLFQIISYHEFEKIF